MPSKIRPCGRVLEGVPGPGPFFFLASRGSGCHAAHFVHAYICTRTRTPQPIYYLARYPPKPRRKLSHYRMSGPKRGAYKKNSASAVKWNFVVKALNPEMEIAVKLECLADRVHISGENGAGFRPASAHILYENLTQETATALYPTSPLRVAIESVLEQLVADRERWKDAWSDHRLRFRHKAKAFS